MVCNWILYSFDLACPEITKIAQFFMAKCRKSRMICYAKNVENHAAFVEGFWSVFYARGRIMKYSMSVNSPPLPPVQTKNSKGRNEIIKRPNQNKRIDGVDVPTMHLVHVGGLFEVYRVGIKNPTPPTPPPPTKFPEQGWNRGGVWWAWWKQNWRKNIRINTNIVQTVSSQGEDQESYNCCWDVS